MPLFVELHLAPLGQPNGPSSGIRRRHRRSTQIQQLQLRAIDERVGERGDGVALEDEPFQHGQLTNPFGQLGQPIVRQHQCGQGSTPADGGRKF